MNHTSVHALTEDGSGWTVGTCVPFICYSFDLVINVIVCLRGALLIKFICSSEKYKTVQATCARRSPQRKARSKTASIQIAQSKLMQDMRFAKMNRLSSQLLKEGPVTTMAVSSISCRTPANITPERYRSSHATLPLTLRPSGIIHPMPHSR